MDENLKDEIIEQLESLIDSIEYSLDKSENYKAIKGIIDTLEYMEVEK